MREKGSRHACTSRCKPPISHVLTRDEVARMIERMSEERHGITGTELIHAYRAGLLSCRCGALDLDAVDILGLASLLDRRDPLWVPS